MDFPDIVNFSECPVNYESSKILLVRNIGNKKTTFNLTVQEPFSVVPNNGYLDIGESMQIEVKFEPEVYNIIDIFIIIFILFNKLILLNLYIILIKKLKISESRIL